MPKDQKIPEENIDKENPRTEDVNDSISQERTTEQPQTTNMEIHHHPDLHHRKKHWKQYFLEFLMIFLAVTLGFFSENIREKITESHRGKEYIKSLAQDLRADSSSLNIHIHVWYGEKSYTDSLINLIKHNIGHQDLHEFYRLIYLNAGYNPFSYHSKTIDQLKSSGSFRLIGPQSLTDNLMEYDNSIKNDLLSVQNKLSDALEKLAAFQHHLIDYTAFILDSMDQPIESHFKNFPDKLLVNPDDKLILNEFLGILSNKRNLLEIEIFLAGNANENIISLLEQINKEYHLE